MRKEECRGTDRVATIKYRVNGFCISKTSGSLNILYEFWRLSWKTKPTFLSK